MSTRSTIGGQRISVAGLLSLVFIYLLLIVLILRFSDAILNNLTLPGNLITIIGVLLIVIIPLVLLVILAVNIGRVIRERHENRPGIKLKIRLLLFFALIAVLSAAPQAILSVNFTRTMLNSWYDSRIGEALDGGLSIAMTYYQEKLARLESFVNGDLIRYLGADGTGDPHQAWEQVLHRAPEIVSMQICDDTGTAVFFAGDENGKAEPAEIRGIRDSFLPKLSVPGASYIRYAKALGSRRTVVVAIKIEGEFDRKAAALTDSVGTFSQIEKFRSVFLYIIIGFYVAFSLPMALFAVFIAFMLSDSFVRPIVDLDEATRRVSEGDFSFRILTRTDDEFSNLSMSFNKMVSELETSRSKILQNEKITVWQDIARRLAHEIKNPLTPIKLNAERVIRKIHTNPADLDTMLEPAMQSIIREVDGLNALLSEFRDFAKLPGPQFEWCNLRNVIHETMQAYQTSFPGVSFNSDGIDATVNLMADRGHLKQVFSNLFKNSIDAMNGSGSITVQADLVKKANSRYYRIQVQDTGGGIPEDIRDRIFAPYFTTKNFGTGLGLSIVEHIVIDHHGQIWFETEKGIGTTFFIDLPVEQQTELEET